jgi:UDPglucose--hexose-1-phosphate uridylyltransferase
MVLGRGGGTVIERRRDPLTGVWRSVGTDPRRLLTEGESCRLCRIAAARRVDGFGVHVVEAAAPTPARRAPTLASPDGPYLVGAPAGAAELLLYGRGHEDDLRSLDPGRLARLVEVWADRYATIGSRHDVAWVSISEERDGHEGHPCTRVVGRPETPPLERLALEAAREHVRRHGTCPGCDVVAQERSDGLRVVARNRTALAHVPFAPSRPFEVHVTSHRHATSLLDLSDPERDDLAELVMLVLHAMRTHLGSDAGYACSVHQAPPDDGEWLDVSHLRVDLAPAAAHVQAVAPEAAAAALRAAAAAIT